MGQVLPGSARTTAAIRRARHHRQQRLQSVAQRYSIHPKTGGKWRQRPPTVEARRGPEPASTVLTTEPEALAVAFRRHTLLALDDCLYARQATMPHLSRLDAAGAAPRRCLVVSNATASAACR
jgi:hypothetical protein